MSIKNSHNVDLLDGLKPKVGGHHEMRLFYQLLFLHPSLLFLGLTISIISQSVHTNRHKRIVLPLRYLVTGPE